MEIHRFEKGWIVAALVLIVLFIGTVAYGAVGAGVTMVSDEGGTIEDVENLDQHPEFGDPGVEQTGPNTYAVYVVARQFAFEPGTSEPIRLPADSEVTFHVTSADVTHGFYLTGTNVNTMVLPGQVAEVTVEFDEPGEYGLVCHEYCGAAHHEMGGQVIVVPPAEYDGGESA
jgi:cytochrome c oxidase subunit 2